MKEKLTSQFSFNLEGVELLGITEIPLWSCHLIQICAGDFPYFSPICFSFGFSNKMGSPSFDQGLSGDPSGPNAVTKIGKIECIINKIIGAKKQFLYITPLILLKQLNSKI